MRKIIYFLATLATLSVMAGCSKDKGEAGNQPEEPFVMRMVGMDVYRLTEMTPERSEIWDYNAVGRISKHIFRGIPDGHDRTLETVTYDMEKIIANDGVRDLEEIRLDDNLVAEYSFSNERGTEISNHFRYADGRLAGFTHVETSGFMSMNTRAPMLPVGGQIQEYEAIWENGNLVELVSDWDGTRPNATRTRILFDYDLEKENLYNIDICMFLMTQLVPALSDLGLNRIFAYANYGEMNKNLIKSVRTIKETRDGAGIYSEGYKLDYLQEEKGVVYLFGVNRSRVNTRVVPETGLYDYDLRFAFTYDKIKK